MYIDAIELVGYSRLDHNHITSIRIRFEEAMQLILGSNGSGKSSLLKEFSPLPADFDDYHPGGRKTVYITHQQRQYVLTSTWVQGKKYSFNCDGVELNPGLTRTIYLDLVKQHFGVTPEIHRVMTNEKSFTRMSKEERRAWFTMCSQVDYTYALKFHQRLKDRHRDLVGSLKRTQERLVQERQHMLTDSDLEANRLMLAALERVTRAWLMQRERLDLDLPGAYRQFNDAVQSALNNSTEYAETRRYVDAQLGRYASLKAFLSWGEGVKQRNTELQTAYKLITQQAARLSSDLEMLQHSRVGSISELQAKAASHQFSIDALVSQTPLEIRSLYQTLPDSEIQSLAMYFNQPGTLLEDLKHLPPDAERRMTPQRLEQYRQEVHTLRESRNQLSFAITEMTESLKRLEHAHGPDVVCPQCDHQFKADTAASERQRLQTQLKFSSQDLERVSRELEITEALLEECDAYVVRLNAITAQMRSVPQANCIWEYVVNRNLVRESPMQLLGWLGEVRQALHNEVAIRSHKAEIAASDALRSSTSSDMSMTIGDMSLELASLEHQLHAISTEQLQLKRQIQVYESVQSGREFLANWDNQVLATRRRIEEANKQIHSATRNLLIDKLIWETDREQTRLSTLVAKQSAQAAVVASLEREVEHLNDQIRIAKYAVQALNPNDGLIAKGLTGFINQFIERMNGMMMRIWRYPIEILPVKTEADELELTYKFKFTTKHTRPKDDVSLGSSAMQEIIDLAFRTVSMAYLGIPTYPLFLDEFGAKFDKAHRDAAFHVVSALSSSDFSQIFMVSHHEQSYSVLHNCGIVVLCDKNIELPKSGRFNQHVEFNDAA